MEKNYSLVDDNETVFKFLFRVLPGPSTIFIEDVNTAIRISASKHTGPFIAQVKKVKGFVLPIYHITSPLSLKVEAQHHLLVPPNVVTSVIAILVE